MADEAQGGARAQRRKSRRARRRWSWWKVLGTGLLTVFLFGAIAVAGTLFYYIQRAPKVTQLTLDSATIIRDRDGNEVYRVHAGQNRTPVPLSDVPRHVQDAFIAIEDPRFREHFGVDIKGIIRAAWRTGLYLLHLPGGQVQGGSTITQQLARQVWLSQEISVKRKIEEWWVAIQLERVYTKDEILEMYLNQIYFGRGAYGIQAAATTYFGKSVKDLTLAEGAQLAGVINGPSYYDPYEHPDASIERRNLVLRAMAEQGYVNPVTYQKAIAEKPNLVALKEEPTEAAAGAGGPPPGNSFTDYVLALLTDTKPGLAAQYGIDINKLGNIGTAGLQVFTTMDSQLQNLAEQALRQQMNAAEKRYGLTGRTPRPEAAMVVMQPRSGELLALVGGRYRRAILEFNRATDALRQPGSAIKPIVVYSPALDAGLSPASVLDDAPVMLSQDKRTVWPENFDFRYQGLVPLRLGVEQSLNPVAVRALQKAGGPQKGLQFGRRFGLRTLSNADNNLALALGGLQDGVSPLNLTEAFAVLANGGQKVAPVVITKIVARDGSVLFEAKPKKEQILRPSVAYLMIDIMKGVIRRGTAYGYTLGFNGWPAAGKTGTTENNRDAWFLGFTPDLVVAVWNGYDNPSTTLKWTGAFVPVQIWNQFMRAAVKAPSPDWSRPADVITVQVCRKSGGLPSPLCPRGDVGPELFVKGTEPKDPGNILVQAQAVQIGGRWLLWQPGCPGIPVNKVFIRRSEPYARHPTDPNNPRYLPADRGEELPTQSCTPGSLLDLLFPPNGTQSGGGKEKGKGNGNGRQDVAPTAPGATPPEVRNPQPTQPNLPPNHPPPDGATQRSGDPFFGRLLKNRKRQLWPDA
jgi:penicillin-binding protein 1A